MRDANFTASRTFYEIDILNILCHSIYYIPFFLRGEISC